MIYNLKKNCLSHLILLHNKQTNNNHNIALIPTKIKINKTKTSGKNNEQSKRVGCLLVFSGKGRSQS